MSRGPYKWYEHNPGISVPKTTTFYRRKWQIEEMEQELLNTKSDHVQQHEVEDNEVTEISMSNWKSTTMQ